MFLWRVLLQLSCALAPVPNSISGWSPRTIHEKVLLWVASVFPHSSPLHS